MTANPLRRGDLVEVRSPAEILATLDERGWMEGLPFMPEMAACCGRRYVVGSRADKVCDTIQYTGSRRVPNSVLLRDLRCNGAEHDGCEAECLIFWKESWLRKVEADTPPPPPVDPQALQALLERTRSHMSRTVEVKGKQRVRWACQNTELLGASQLLGYFDPRPFINEFTNGNASLGHVVTITARAVQAELLRKVGARPHAPVQGTGTGEDDPNRPPLNLKAGDWVRVKSLEEIAATLNPEGFSRGMWFDREMAPYCGKIFKVRRVITRFIDENDSRERGKMIKLGAPAVTLETVVCKGEHSLGRWFCPRFIFPYWRECWLERVEPPPAGFDPSDQLACHTESNGQPA